MRKGARQSAVENARPAFSFELSELEVSFTLDVYTDEDDRSAHEVACEIESRPERPPRVETARSLG